MMHSLEIRRASSNEIKRGEQAERSCDTASGRILPESQGVRAGQQLPRIRILFSRWRARPRLLRKGERDCATHHRSKELGMAKNA